MAQVLVWTQLAHDLRGKTAGVEPVKDTDYKEPSEPLPTIAFLVAHGLAEYVEQ